MEKHLRRFALLASLIGLMTAPALSCTNVGDDCIYLKDSLTWTQQTSPIHLDKCIVGVDQDGYHVEGGLAFTNTSSKDVAAVRFTFFIINGFDEIVGSPTLTYEGLFSPGIRIDKSDPGWQVFNRWSDIAHVVCGVSRVKYSDGTQWSEQSPSSFTMK